MPQLKKLSAHQSNILPKMNLSESFGCGNNNTFPPSYLALLIEEDSSQILTSEPESDVSDSVQNRPRKRQRLDHLSQEEKVMRRKLKNRVAAQTARDRKKAKMQELEDQVSCLVTEKRMLLLKTVENMKRIQALEQENSELKLRLGLKNACKDEQKVIVEREGVEEPSRVSVESRSLEQAEGTGSADSITLDDAVRLLASNSETDDLLDLLRQCGEDIMECDFNDTYDSNAETRQQQLSHDSEVVGSTSKSLESNKELIHFDHIYSKQEDCLDGSLCLPLPESELSTKDSLTLIATSDDLEGIVEIVDSSSNIPIISISSNPSDPQLNNDIMPFECDTFSFGDLNEHLLSPPVDGLKHCSSPASSSDTGYDSSFSASSPCGDDAGNPWDDTLTELFPSLV